MVVSGHGQHSRLGRGATAVASGLAAARPVAGDGGRVGGAPAGGAARSALRRGVLARENGETSWLGVHLACPRSPSEGSLAFKDRIRTPPPFRSQDRPVR